MLFGRKKEKQAESSEKGEQVYAVIPAAGTSTRMGQDKLMMEICGKPVLRYTLEAFDLCECIDGIILSCRASDIERYRELCREWGIKKPVTAVEGGETRAHSIYNGILKCSKSVGYVSIHDAARPFVTPELIKETVETAMRDTAAAPALPVTDSIKRVKNGRMVEDIKRDTIVAVQTPQSFDIDLIRAALKKAITEGVAITDDCGAAELIGQPTTIVKGDPNNIKLTTRSDILLAEKIVKGRNA